MKTKQMVSIIVTGAVILTVGVTGVVSNVISNKLMVKEQKKNVGNVIGTFIGEDSGKMSLPEKDYIGVVNVVGEIGPSSSSVFGGSSGSYDHDLYMKYVDEMMKSETNKGILLYVDSPGGTVYEADEFYLKLMEYKEKTNRPIWAYFASEACSGGYYISMAADRIYSNRNGWTGSIGVIISFLNYAELYDKLGIKEMDFASGKNKTMGSAALELTQEQRDIFQSLVDEAYDQFVGIVAEGRNMDETKVRELADGRIYTALQAKENALIDEIGSLEDLKAAFEEEASLAKDITYYEPEGDDLDFLVNIFSAAQQLTPKSEADLISEIVKKKGSGVLMYHAE